MKSPPAAALLLVLRHSSDFTAAAAVKPNVAKILSRGELVRRSGSGSDLDRWLIA